MNAYSPTRRFIPPPSRPARLAERRNELVVALAGQILLLHAAPNSHTEQLLRAAQQKPLLTLTLDDESLCRQLNANAFAHRKISA